MYLFIIEEDENTLFIRRSIKEDKFEDENVLCVIETNSDQEELIYTTAIYITFPYKKIIFPKYEDLLIETKDTINKILKLK